MTGIPTPLVGTLSQNTTGATPLNVAYPASLTSSHIMVLFVSANSTTTFPTLPSGWTQVFRGSEGSNTTAPSLLVAIKQATGSETGSLAVTTPTVKSTGQIIAFTGVNLTTPQDVTASTVDASTAATTVVIPGVTTTRAGCALVYVAAHNAGSDTASPPTSPATFTETGDNTGAGGWAGTMGYLIWSGVGATGNVTVTFNGSAKGLGVLLALRALDESATAPLTGTGTLTADSTMNRGATGTETGTATLTASSSVNRGASATETVTAGLTADSLHNVGASATETVTATLTADTTLVHAGSVKVWNGSAWVLKPIKVWNGSAWVAKPLKVWDGSAWVTK